MTEAGPSRRRLLWPFARSGPVQYHVSWPGFESRCQAGRRCCAAARLRAAGSRGSFPADLRRPFYAASAFGALGRTGDGAIPELTRLANEADDYFKSVAATQALGRIGQAGLPPLLDLLQSDKIVIRARAANAIAYLGSNALPAIPLLVEYVTNVTDMDVAHAAVTTLGILGLEPDRVVPALSNVLHSPQPFIRRAAVRGLGRFATNTAVARSALAIAMVDPETTVRELATNTLLGIAPEALTNSHLPTNAAPK